MSRIDFEAKTDRELLVLVAQKCNESSVHLKEMNDKLVRHERRLTYLESHGGLAESTWQAKVKANWPTLSLLVVVITLVVITIMQSG